MRKRPYSTNVKRKPQHIVLGGGAESSAKHADENPDRPEFCPPFETGDPVRWLDLATTGLGQLCDQNEARYLKGIDSEVIAAIYLEREVRNNAELQAAWCQLPGWSEVKLKAPKPGKTERLLEEVFRYHWGVMRNDPDGYEMRFRAVKRHYRPNLEPEAIVALIRRSGGYKKAAKKIVPTSHSATEQEEPLVSIELASAATRGPKPENTSETVADGHSTVTFAVAFLASREEAEAQQGSWVTWRVKPDWTKSPPRLLVRLVAKNPS